MRLFIPSSGRAHRQDTILSLPPSVLERTTLVVPYEEYDEYNAKWRSRISIEAPNIRAGIGPARQWCVEQSLGGKVLMFDDDLVFATRRLDEPSKFLDSNHGEIERALEDIEVALDRHSHVGMSTREGGNRYHKDWDYNVRILRVLAYDTVALEKYDIHFDEAKVMEDFYVSLSLLTKGLTNAKLNWMVHNQGGSNTAGGCSQYRTMELQATAAHELHAHFPDFVTVVEKETKKAWGGGTRTDVRIQWKAAYKWGVRYGSA